MTAWIKEHNIYQMNPICLCLNLTNYLYDSIISINYLFLLQEQVFVESQDFKNFNDQDESFCESSMNPLNVWFWKFKEENCFDNENELDTESKLAWWPKADIDRVSSTQEEYVDNQFLDVKDINHSDLDNLETPISIETNKSGEERKPIANEVYNKYIYKSNIMIDQIASNLYNN